MRPTLALPLLLVCSTAAAGPNPTVAGRWKQSVNDTYPGYLWLAPVGDQICGYYSTSQGPGGLTLKLEGSTLSGTWHEGLDQGVATFKLASKALAGTYTENMTDPGTSPWTATYEGAANINVPTSWDLDWGDTDKLSITLKRSGNKLDAKLVYRYSKSDGGSMTGTIYGDVWAGTWKSKGEDGTMDEGKFVLAFRRNITTNKYDILEGISGADLANCANSSRLRGNATK